MALIQSQSASVGAATLSDFYLKTDAALSSTPQLVKDRANNVSDLYLSDGGVGIGAGDQGQKLFVLADGSIGATVPLLIENSNGDDLFTLLDNGSGNMLVGNDTSGFSMISANFDARLFFGASNVPAMNLHVRNIANTANRPLRYFGLQFSMETLSGALQLNQMGTAIDQTHATALARFATSNFNLTGLPIGAGGPAGQLYIDNISIPGVNVIAVN
jgi:hypothetical protein